MKKMILSLIAACIGCCAVAFVFPALLAGGTAVGLTTWLGKFSLEAVLCALPLGLAVSVAVAYVFKRRKPKKTCASDGTCGCR
jgi:membrane protein implicated in regulation of membrane protease activity